MKKPKHNYSWEEDEEVDPMIEEEVKIWLEKWINPDPEPEPIP